MKSLPSFQQVLDGIGEKAVRVFSLSVRRAARDLQEYRTSHPQWVADHSERGLANWISDRTWAHLVALADGVSDMTVVEKGVLREVALGVNYRFRVKRHDYGGNIESYPTDSFLEFAEQPQGQIPGLEETRLVAGYEWHKEERQIGDAVISLRDGKDNIHWMEPLPEFPDDAHGDEGGSVVTPQSPKPQAPNIGVSESVGQEAGEVTDDK